MEISRGAHHVCIAMDDGTRVGEARRHARTLAAQAGLDEVQAGRLAIVVTELANNVLSHARHGVLMLGIDEARGEVEVLAIDRGPGIGDIARAETDGFSTAGTTGTGLGAARRLARDYELHSVAGEGTVIVARVAASGAAAHCQASVCASGLAVPLAGELVCGDAWAVATQETTASVLLADGLGHGPDAAEAAQAAVDVFVGDPFIEPARIVAAMHTRLRSTRGAAVLVLRLDPAKGTIRSCGAGNVAARVVSGAGERTILSQHGTAGVQVRRPEESVLEWPPHALVVLHTDGIESRWSAERLMPVLGRDLALAGALLLRDHSRGRDDATVVVLRRSQ
jgi:anti-sigma regulatory factor (Ser/Thr protein kinase)